jgi:rhodanese-related sulfurtransferase
MSDVLHHLPEFLGNHFYLTLAFVGVFVALLVNEAQRFMRGYAALTPAGLTQLINRENALLIDVSAQAEFEKGHIPGAKHVAMSAFDPESKDLAKARELPVVVIDRDGRGNAAKAAQRLVKAGFTKVHTLAGGTLAWRAAQLPVAKGNK